MSDPGFSNDWWGRDPIELAGEEEIETEAQRMRRVNEAFKEDYKRLFHVLFGSSLPEIKQ
jgi:hypothetical protein